jgi:signal transduction histidine kinase
MQMSASTIESSASRKGTWELGSGIFPAHVAAGVNEQLAEMREASAAAHLIDDPLDTTRILNGVIWNLLSKAIEFTPDRGRVDVFIESGNDHMEVRVADTGHGISPDFLPHVFERFRQDEDATTQRHTGLGLGLGIVGQLVEFHGGTVQAASPGVGHGATFTVRLPIAAGTDRR